MQGKNGCFISYRPFNINPSVAATVKGHKYSSLSKKMREIFTPVVHTVNRKTGCRARVWSIKAGKISKNRNRQTCDQEHEKKSKVPERKKNKSCLCFDTSLIQSFNIKFKVRALKNSHLFFVLLLRIYFQLS